MKKLTHNDLPDAISKLMEMIEMVLFLLQNPVENKTEENSDRWMTLEELREYIPSKPSRSDIYKKTHRKEIPFSKPCGRLIFRKSEIDAYLATGKSKTLSQISCEAEDVLAEIGNRRK